MQVVNGKYALIKISCTNPKIGEILWDKKVAAELVEKSPSDGWDKIPDGLDKVRE